MKRILIAALGALCLVGSGYGAKNPLNEKYATKLSPKTSVKTTTVRLYKTKDDQKQTVYRCYCKMTLQKGKAYTVWLTGINSSNSNIRIRTAYGQDPLDYTKGDKNAAWNINEPLAHFENIDCGVETRWLVSGKQWANDWTDDWDTTSWTDAVKDDWGINWGKSTTPNSWTYYILIEGKKGSTAKLNYAIGNKIPKGVAANPLVIKPTNKVQEKTLLDGFMGEFYYVQAKLKGGVCYRFGTKGGSSANKLSFDTTYNLNLGILGPYGAWNKSTNGAISFIPDGDQTVLMRIRSSKGYKAKGKIRFFIGINRSRTMLKGTDIMLRALERIVADYPAHAEMVKAESVPFVVYKEMMRSSDVLLDQIYSYTPAMNALQAMSQGLIVVSGGEEENYEILGEEELRPIINVQPDEEDIYYQLEQLVLHPERIAKLKRDSVEYVRRHHDSLKVAERYLEAWNK